MVDVLPNLIPHMVAVLDPEAMKGFLEWGGYLLLFGVLFACGLGLPLPEDVPLIAAGALIHVGTMHWGPAGVVAWLGIISGDLVLYHIGKRFGPNITRVPFVGKHINVARLKQVELLFEKYGVWVVGVGRMFAGIRGAMVVTAGTIRFNRVKFLIADGLAAIVSGGLFLLLGYWLGQNLPALWKKVESGKVWVLLGAIVIVAIVAAWWYVRHKRRVRAASLQMTDTH